MIEKECLVLKWGTIKSWNFNSDEGKDLLRKYFDLGTVSGAMFQEDTPEQKEIICQLIDLCSGEIWTDWDGMQLNKEQAKKYVMGEDEAGLS